MTDDLISRQAAIDAINSHFGFDVEEEYGSAVQEVINGLPPAQPDISEYSDKLWKKAYERGKAEALDEIVRCKDCKHQVKEWRDDKRLKEKGYWVYGCNVISEICGYWAWFGQDDEFCSEAERRTDE